MRPFLRRAGSSADFEEKAALRSQILTTGPRKRAANLLLHVSDVARKVCRAVGQNVVGYSDGVGRVLGILRGSFAPDAIDSIFQDMAKCLCFTHTDQFTGAYLMEFDMLRQKAEARACVRGVVSPMNSSRRFARRTLR